MKYLVVGLGNIGAEYADTRHNIGFKVLDCLAEQSNIAFTTAPKFDIARIKSIFEKIPSYIENPQDLSDWKAK